MAATIDGGGDESSSRPEDWNDLLVNFSHDRLMGWLSTDPQLSSELLFRSEMESCLMRTSLKGSDFDLCTSLEAVQLVLNTALMELCVEHHLKSTPKFAKFVVRVALLIWSVQGE